MYPFDIYIRRISHIYHHIVLPQAKQPRDGGRYLRKDNQKAGLSHQAGPLNVRERERERLWGGVCEASQCCQVPMGC